MTNKVNKKIEIRNSLIHAYGLFWRRDEINWNPGKGNANEFRLLGRDGSNAGTLRIIDARLQAGLYILYGNYGPYYVGKAQSLGTRLKRHLSDEHSEKWDRFLWFGFNPVLVTRDNYGIKKLGKVAQSKHVTPQSIIEDVEALLIVLWH